MMGDVDMKKGGRFREGYYSIRWIRMMKLIGHLLEAFYLDKKEDDNYEG